MSILDKLSDLFGDSSDDKPKKLEHIGDQSAEEIKLAGFCRSEVERCRSSANRIAHEGIWMTNIAYLLGYDGLMYNTTTRQFQPINRASAYLRKNRVHVNKILPTIQNRLARLSQSPPKYDVRPESNSSDDKEAARLSLQTLTCLWDRLEIDKKRLFLYMWMQQCGHAYIGTLWDPTLGKIMKDPDTGETHFEGEIRIDVCSPFELFPDDLARTDDDLKVLTRCKIRKLDYFKTHYPERGHLVKEESAWLLSAQYDQRINSLNSRGPSQGGLTDVVKDSAIELTRYEAPSKEYPQGRMIVSAAGVLLENKELPIGEIPYTKFDDVIIGGKYYSESIITHLRPIQDQYNETIRRRGEWTKRLLAGKYKAPRGSGLAQESLNDESGEMLYYNVVPGAPNGPEPLELPAIPEYAYKEEDRLDGHINYISGIGDVSRGNLPSASLPAIGAQLLQEQDQTRISVVTELNERSWAKVGRHILKSVEKFYVLPRKIKNAGDNLEYAVRDVLGQELRGNTDCIVVRGSTLPGSKTLKRQDIANGMQMGLLGDVKNPAVAQKIAAMMEYGDSEDIWKDYGVDMAQIRRGIASIETGIPTQPDEMDNHALWIGEINRLRKTDKFDAYPPQVKDLFMQTREAHIQMIMTIGNMIPPNDESPPPPQPSQPQAGQQPQGAPHQQSQVAQSPQLPNNVNTQAAKPQGA